MLFITQEIEDIRYAELMRVYQESNKQSAEQNYSHCSQAEQLISAEQDLYQYLQFVLSEGAWFAAWILSGSYESALRLEPYENGLLITALETAPEVRGCGYAGALLHAVVEQFPTVPIYAHIYIKNHVSRHIHEKNGFVRIKNSAEFLDGTVSMDAYTYKLER